MTPFVFVLATLAAFRLAWLVSRDEGPFSVFAWLREHVDVAQKTWLGRGLNCVVCTGFWTSLFVTVLLCGSWLEWLAMATVVMIINKAMLR